MIAAGGSAWVVVLWAILDLSEDSCLRQSSLLLSYDEFCRASLFRFSVVSYVVHDLYCWDLPELLIWLCESAEGCDS